MKTYWQLCKIHFSSFLEYRADLFFSFLMKVGVFVAFVILWRRLEQDGNQIDGYGLYGIIFYYLATIVIDGFITSQAARDIRTNIHDGTLSTKLVKPLRIIPYFIIKHFSRVFSELLINTTFALPVFFILPKLLTQIHFSFLISIQFLSIAFCASLFSFNLFFLVGLCAFWTKQAFGLQMIVKNGTKILTGAYIPLDLLPVRFQNIISYMPFPYTIFYPIQVLRGNTNTAEFIHAAIILITWTLIFLLVNCIVWKKGLHTYESVGI